MLRLVQVLTIFGCLILAGCPSEPEKLPLIRLGHAPHDHHAALYIAAQLPDYFRQHGGLYLREIEPRKRYQLMEQDQPLAELQIEPSKGGGQLVRKLHEKQYDFIFGGVPAMIKQIAAGSSLKMVAPLMSEGAGLVLAKDFPASDWDSFIVAVRQAERPVRIGYKIQTSVQNLIFEQALRAEGIRFVHEQAEQDSQLVALNLFGAQNLLPALQNGLIDGYVVMQPFTALAEYRQQGKVVAQLRDLPPDRQWLGHPCCAMAANGELLRQQRELLSKLIVLFWRANRYLQENPQESAEYVANWLDQPLQVESLSLPTINYLDRFSGDWQRGIEIWLHSLDQQQRLSPTLQDSVESGQLDNLLYDMPLYKRARTLLEQE